ncbi:MAG: hypothetical protein JWO72_919 [Caulobacteraceae bacterium]|nr:hypothetical protein [Caulobacteraceae bacterium]
MLLQISMDMSQLPATFAAAPQPSGPTRRR